MPVVAIRISTCLETEKDPSGAANSTEIQTFLGEVLIISCQQTLQPFTLNVHE